MLGPLSDAAVLQGRRQVSLTAAIHCSCDCLCVCSLQKRLGEMHDQIAQINKEEELFKWTPTSYPQLEQVQATIEPYHKLFSTIFRWQKAERKIMDGSFLELNAENTQAEVEEFGREMYKLFKKFNAKAKQSKAAAGRELSQQTKQDSSKEEEFAPLKMTSCVQEKIKEFKVSSYSVLQCCCYCGCVHRTVCQWSTSCATLACARDTGTR